MEEIKKLPCCPFCGIIPEKEPMSTANGHHIKHKQDCFLKAYIWIQDSQIDQWERRSKFRGN